MLSESEIVNLLTKELGYAYCDNCRYVMGEDDACDNCHRKYSGWSLSEDTATYLARKIVDRKASKEKTTSKSYISSEERIERLNAVRHEIGQHFNEGFAWIDQILCEEIEQIDLEEQNDKDINVPDKGR